MTEKDREIETLRDLLAQAQKANNSLSARIRELEEWQPIETAPQSIPILTYDGSKYIEIATKDFEGFFITDIYKRDKYKPTHWKPLPQPPKENER